MLMVLGKGVAFVLSLMMVEAELGKECTNVSGSPSTATVDDCPAQMVSGTAVVSD